ncbi:hypothetical protein Sjap_014055 [Stephania japonica]|uniref:Dynamin stalk domain-containing protein n=1 Tax=Stephania japonica TaxID=461633 RepID=A0AAP0IZ70_9MAGN
MLKSLGLLTLLTRPLRRLGLSWPRDRNQLRLRLCRSAHPFSGDRRERTNEDCDLGLNWLAETPLQLRFQLKLIAFVCAPLKLIDLPGLDQRIMDEYVGPSNAADVPWVTLIGQSVSIASAQSGSVGSENSLKTACLASKSQMVQDELVRLGEQMVHTTEGTRAIALELCREFEEKFLQHIATGWKIVASFKGNFPNRIKQLPLDRHFDITNVKRFDITVGLLSFVLLMLDQIVLEANGYQPYLISREKGLRSLIKGALELAKEPSRLCVDEVHHVLVDIVSTAANFTPGLGRYPPFKRLMERQRREDEQKNRSSKKAQDAEQALLNRATSPQTGQQTGGSLESMKDKSNQPEKDAICWKGSV